MSIVKKCASTLFMLLVCLSFNAQKSSLAASWSKEDIQQIIISESRKSKYVTPALALAVAEIESGFRADPISSKGAVGVMQIMPLTAKSVFNVPRFQLFDPVINIRLGVRFLDQLIVRYHGRIDLALSHYNGGSKVGKWPNARIIPATRPYVKKFWPLPSAIGKPCRNRGGLAIRVVFCIPHIIRPPPLARHGNLPWKRRNSGCKKRAPPPD